MAVGKPVKRVDGVAKVTGRAKFTGDFFIPGMLTAKVFRSTIANGKVTKIDIKKAKALPGVEGVFTFKDVPQIKFSTAGHPYSTDPAHKDIEDRLILTQRVRYYGDEIAVVVAEDELIADEALKLIEVEYDEYQVITDVDNALAEFNNEIHEGSKNLVGEHEFTTDRNIDEVFADAAIKVDDLYVTNMVHHCHIENHIAYAYMNDETHIEIVSSTQIPHIVRRVVGQALGIPWGSVRVIKPYIGGGFGNKQDVIIEPLVAFLTQKLGGQPVKLDMDREECMLTTRNRHPYKMNIKIGASKSGTLLGIDVDGISNTGAYASHGHSVISAGFGKACFVYPRAAQRYHARTVYTNIPVAGAMRAYGVPQIVFGLECAVDDTARKIGIDPLEFRLKNAVRRNDPNPRTGEPILSAGLVECLEKGKNLIHWEEKKKITAKTQSGNIRRGLGVASFSYACGTYPVCVELSGVRIILNQDGSIHVQVGATEIGQGSDTVIAQMAARTIGLEFDRVHVVSTQDTDVAPFDTGAYASRQTYVVSNAVFKAASELKEKILSFAEELTGVSAGKLDILKGRVVYQHDSDKTVITLNDLAIRAYYDKNIGRPITADVSHKTRTNARSFGCTFVDLEIDIPLCKVTINEIYNIHDSGVIINPVLATGQVHGGMAMGIGAALSEVMLIDDKSGYIYNNNLLDYKIPTITDIPDLNCDFVETFEPTSGYGNKSLGEPPIVSPPPAIRNAILDATGVAINELPMSPQVIFKHFKQADLL